MIRINLWVLIVILTMSCKEDRSLNPTPPIQDDPLKTEGSNKTIKNLLKVENPVPGQFIQSPLKIYGEARGYWFFEADATAELLDENLQKISETNTTAIGQWMTEDWVPFSGIMTFEKPATVNGFLVLHKANASGLKEHEMSDTIPVKFRTPN